MTATITNWDVLEALLIIFLALGILYFARRF